MVPGKASATVAALAALATAGCTPAQYAEQADRAAYRTLRQGQQAALGRERPFEVDYRPLSRREASSGDPIRVGQKEIPLGAGPPVALTIEDCLHVAFRNSREFQDRREELYSNALAVASSRRTWNWSLIEGSLGGSLDSSEERRGPESDSVSSDDELSLTQRFVQGGVLTLAASLTFARDLVGGHTTAGSLLEANLTQPLLRGAWRKLAYEDQYRLERDFLFAVFGYERFRQTFAADIVSRYYSVLQQRDQLENEARSIERLAETLELTKLRVEGGQVSPIQQDEAEANLLDARVRQQINRQNYEDSLDSFKITLGLPIAAQVKLNYPEALDTLNERAAEQGLAEVELTEAEAIGVAMRTRPDVLAARAQVRDARRDVEIAADQFLPQLDLELGLNAPGTDPQQWHRVQFHRYKRYASLTFDYPLDQTPNRDAYRSALLALDKAKRDLEQFLDREVRLDVRQSYRAMVQSRRTYKIRRRSVEIAERRHKLAMLEQREGLASARDVLEAEESLRQAENDLTRALVNYTRTRIRLLASLGLIEADEEGNIHERAEPVRFDRLGGRYPYVSP